MAKKMKFPVDIQLSESPLIEAWLEIRWELEEVSQGMMVDKKYPYALGVFFDSIKDTFGFSEALPASQAPDGLLPYIVQHRFRYKQNDWPLLQIGPGIATVNYTTPYKWSDFLEKALFVREKLISAYGEDSLKTQKLILRYRNGHPFTYSTDNIYDFLKNNINISISLPENIFEQTSNTNPTHTRLITEFELDELLGNGKITIGSGQKQPDNTEIVLWELEVSSHKETAPDISDEKAFGSWLNDAHQVIHEWFFSLIEGNLFEEYSKE